MKKLIDELVKEVTDKFRHFGGGTFSEDNPLSFALRNVPPQFAAGVDIREVVEIIAQKAYRAGYQKGKNKT